MNLKTHSNKVVWSVMDKFTKLKFLTVCGLFNITVCKIQNGRQNS